MESKRGTGQRGITEESSINDKGRWEERPMGKGYSMELIRINSNRIGEEVKETVDARELHDFLCITSKFADWIKNRINDFDFVENQDFVTFSKNLENGGKSKEYALTLDMAKELSMVERNALGKRARQYFIECERRAKRQPDILKTQDPLLASIQALQVVRQHQLDHEKRLIRLEAKSTTRETNYFTIIGFGRLQGMIINRHEASMYGKRATKLSASLNYPIQEEYDARYGTVGSYHRDVLTRVFEGE